MKKAMFKKVLAGIAAVFTLGLCVPTGFTNIITQPSFEAVAEDEWLNTYGIEYKIKDSDTLIINDNSDVSIKLYDFYFKSYAADIKHLQIGKGWKINSFIFLTAIESLTIGDNCNIGENAFYGYSALTSVKIGDNCSIRANAFYGCSALTSVKIGKECKFTAIMNNFPNSAFENCATLTSVEIGEGCTIGRRAFYGCNSIQKVICIGDKNTVTVDDYNPEIICNKEKWITPSKCPKCSGWVIDFKCESCGYFDKAAAQAEIDANEAEIKQKENEIKQKENEITQKQERNAYLKSLLNEQETQSENESDNNTASTFSDGSVLVIVGGSTFLILCGLAAVIIVKRRKKTQ